MARDASSGNAVRTGFARHGLFADQVGEALPGGFPFDSVFSLAPIIEQWRTLRKDDPATYAAAWQEIERELDAAPALTRPVQDHALLELHHALVSRLIHPLFPGSAWSSEARALGDPFGKRFLYRTRRFEDVLGLYGEHAAAEAINANDAYIRTLYAYQFILKTFYGVTLPIDLPLVFVVPDPAQGLNRYFKLNGSTRFITVGTRGDLPALNPSDIDELFDHIDDLPRWMERLPPALFQFVGVSPITMTDVTHETATASIQQIVLTSDADITEDNFDLLQQEVRNLLRKPTLRMGVASVQGNGALNFGSARRTWNSLVIRDPVREHGLDWRGTVYDRALRADAAIYIRDVAESPLRRDVRQHLLDLGVRSLFLQPLRYRDRIVGLFELSSPAPGDLDASVPLKVRGVQSIFALAVYQNLERFETRVESLIQQTYTAIHPSVTWSFREAAIAMLEHEKQTGSFEAVPIVFEQLYPLYGSADMCGSTQHRNEAVRCDVVLHLRHAQEAIEAIRSAVPLTILDELHHRIAGRIERFEAAWNAGDEAAARQFITQEVDPLLQSVAGDSTSLRSVLHTYREQTSGCETLRARAYESSRQQINRLITDLLLAEQDAAQPLFPHYFEHTKTDGVAHTMYIGESIAPARRFDLAYVQNLRLRQLILACRITQHVRRLHETLEMPLDIAQLILVQNAPITLRFRIDEKKFDVEGASGVRFELLKKRLDKAVVKGSDERIRQPDQVTIVYSTEQEAAEYSRHVAYLAASGYVADAPERLDVENLPGVSGLKMLRFPVRV